MTDPAPDHDPLPALRDFALDCLARRDYCRIELERRLLNRAKAARHRPAITALLDALSRSGALDETRHAEAFVRARCRRGHGSMRIRQDLRQRGADTEVIAAVLENYRDQWPALAARARHKRFGEELPNDAHERARQARFLQQRGFDGEAVCQALAAAEGNETTDPAPSH